MDIFDAVRLRRSVKPEDMDVRAIPREVLDRLFEAANWAPSHGLTEPWRFIVHEGESRLALGRAMLSAMARGVPIPEDDPRHVKLMTKVKTAPVVVAIVCEPSQASNVYEHEEIASTAMAVQNLHLCARALGLAAFWSSGEKTFGPEFAAFLSLRPPKRCLGVLFVGYPAGPWPESRRGAVADKIVWRA
ncbi:MAG: nitroreductase [Myxococcales bacterium]|nr:nitroreductase [Myxococcales bacterium]